jgi:hypothetical protein
VDTRANAAATGLGFSLAGSSLWLWLMRASGSLAGVGRLCGHAAGQWHCPACYGSAGLAFLGLAIATATLAAPARPVRA